MQGLLMIGISVPPPRISSGLEAPIRLTLGFYGVPSGRGSSYALTYHCATFSQSPLARFLGRFPHRLGLGSFAPG